MSTRHHLIAVACLSAALAGCLDFEKAYNECFEQGHCIGASGPATPQIVSTEPANRANNVDPSALVTITFDRPMNRQALSATLTPSVSLVAATWDDASQQVTLTPAARLSYGTQYTLRVGGTSAEGGVLDASDAATFTTMAAPRGPALIATVPSKGSNVVALDAGLTLTFDAPVAAQSFSVVMTPPTLLGLPSWNVQSTEVTFPDAPVYAEATTYSVMLEGTGTDGLAFTPPTSFSFQTVADGTRPTITSVTPLDQSVDVSVTSSPSITFSEAMNAGSVAAAITMEPADAGCTWVLDSVAKKTVTCMRTAMFAPDAGYTVHVSTAATDLASLPLSAPFQYSFATGRTPDTTPPTVVSTTPGFNATAIDPAQQLSVTFSEAMAPVPTEAAISFSAPTGIVATAFSWSPDGKTVSFSASPAPADNTIVNWQIGTGAADVAGNHLQATLPRSYKTWRFVTTTLTTEAALDGEVRLYNSGYQLFQGSEAATAGSTGSPQVLRAFFSFNMTAVRADNPTVFVDATLSLTEWYYAAGNRYAVGNPFGGTKGPIIAENVDYGTSLDATAADYGAPAIAVCTSPLTCSTPQGMITTITLGNQISNGIAHTGQVLRWFTQQYTKWNGSGTSPDRNIQFRVRCTTEPLSSATTTDYTGFQTGETTQGAPATLTVRYYAP